MGGFEGCDPVLLDLFRAEMDTHLPTLSQGLLALEKDKAGPKDLEAMMRAAHSIKGAARIVGVDAAVQVAHGMEDCFSAAQGQRLALGSEAVDVLLRGLDALQAIVSPQPDMVINEQSLESLLAEIAAVMVGKFSMPCPLPTKEPPGNRSELQFETSTRSASAGSDPGPARDDLVTSGGEPQDRRLLLPVIFDDGAAQRLRDELCDIVRNSPSRLRVDFSEVTFVSAAALSLLASFAREVSQFPADFAVEADGVSPTMAVLLRTSGLDRTIRPIG